MRLRAALVVLALAGCKQAPPPPPPAAPSEPRLQAPVAAEPTQAPAETPVERDVPQQRAEPVEPEPEPTSVGRPPRAARLEAWLDTKAVRKSPYAVNTLAILDDFPFFVFQDGGLDPVRDVDYLHVAGAPYGSQRIVIVARHSLKKAPLKGALERAMAPYGFGIGWRDDAGVTFGETLPAGATHHSFDNFEFVLPDKRHVVFTETGTTAGADIDRLEAFRKKRKDIALAVDFYGITGGVPRLDGTWLDAPKELSLEVDATKTPLLKVTAEYPDDDAAADTLAFLLGDVKTLVESKPELRYTIGSLYRSAKIEHDRTKVSVSVRLTAQQGNLLLDIAEGFVEMATGRSQARDARRRTLRKTSPPR